MRSLFDRLVIFKPQSGLILSQTVIVRNARCYTTISKCLIEHECGYVVSRQTSFDALLRMHRTQVCAPRAHTHRLQQWHPLNSLVLMRIQASPGHYAHCTLHTHTIIVHKLYKTKTDQWNWKEYIITLMYISFNTSVIFESFLFFFHFVFCVSLFLHKNSNFS